MMVKLGAADPKKLRPQDSLGWYFLLKIIFMLVGNLSDDLEGGGDMDPEQQAMY